MHTPVLLKETIENLNFEKGEIFLDATLGEAGHSLEVCKKMGGKIKIIGIDADIDAVKKSKEIFLSDEVAKNSDFVFVEGNFRDLNKILDELNIKKINKVLFDLGVRSANFEESGRGFTFQKDEPLIMTFSKNTDKVSFTAEEIINEWDEENIAEILYGYGEETFSRQIAKNIVLGRKIKPIKSTFQLINIISSSIPDRYRKGKTHFATKTFQALRMAVNDEVLALKEGLEKAFNRMDLEGRMAVISFHSIEDRMVKRFFKDKSQKKECSIITKKPIVPNKEEILKNPRSRSSKLRIIQKLSQ